MHDNSYIKLIGLINESLIINTIVMCLMIVGHLGILGILFLLLK